MAKPCKHGRPSFTGLSWRLLRSPLIAAGLLLWLACLATWAFVWTVSRQQAIAIATTFGAFFVAGKLAAIPFGYLQHLPPLVIGLIVLVPDVGAIFVAYPLTRGGIRVLGRWSGSIRRLHANAVRAAHRREGFVARYGGLGVFVLALLPVGFYSPLVVSAIGQLAGLSARRVIVPVVAGMCVMTTFWVVVLGYGFTAVSRLNPRLPFVISLGLLLLFVGIDVVRRLRGRRKGAPREADVEEPGAPSRPPSP